MTNNMQSWTVFLDSLETEIEQANADLDAGRIFNDALLEPWSPPKNLEALPLELLERAQVINQALNDLQRRAEANQVELKSEISRIGNLKNKKRQANSQYGETVIPRYVDRSV